MKLIKPSFSILPQSEGLEGIYKQIELAGRTCYKSENYITEDSAKEFAERMIKLGHGAMLEHGTLYFKIPANIDYSQIKHISTETKEKLEKIRPTNLAQASRIGGVKPADISVLMVMLKK